MFRNSGSRDRNGATLLLYTMLLTFLVIPVTGLSIDLARVYVAQGRLQAAVDAAALGTTRLLGTTANSSEIAGEFLRANYPTGYWQSSAPSLTSVNITTTTTSQSVKVVAGMTIPLIFLDSLSHNAAHALNAVGNHTVYPLQPCTLTYPTGSAPSLSSVVFNESTVLFNWGPSYIYPHGKLIAYYTDEHALMLGVNQVNVITADGTVALTIAFPGGNLNGTIGTPYSETLTAAGGTSPYTFSITSGSLPAGLTLNASTGVISGIPTAVVSGPAANITATVTDSLGGTATANGTINIASNGPLNLTFPGGANGQVGVPYNLSLTATGGTAPYTFSISAGTLPAGLILNASTGAITGEPTAVVSGPAANITAKVVDSTSANKTVNGTINVNAAGALTVTLPGGPPNNAMVGTPFSNSLTGAGGIQPYTFSISAGSLPAGLSLTGSTGAITGQPTTQGNTTFTAKVVDAHGTSATASASINVAAAGPLKVNFPGGANGTVGTAYIATLTGSGGISPYTYSFSVGTLPAGLTLNSSTGVISGTPTTAVSGPAANLTAKITDHAGTTATVNGSINIAAAPPPPGGGGTTKITTTTNYPFSTFNSSTYSAVSWTSPLPVGTTALTGQQAGTDTATWNSTFGYLDKGRPLWPAIFITDITINPAGNSGDWQQGGTLAVAPNAVYGTWKGAIKTYDTTTLPATVTTTLDADPAKNTWAGLPDVPSGGWPGSSEGYSTEIVWNVDSLGLRPGRIYRLQFMIHDGDQNQSGGDSGEGCAVAVY